MKHKCSMKDCDGEFKLDVRYDNGDSMHQCWRCKRWLAIVNLCFYEIPSLPTKTALGAMLIAQAKHKTYMEKIFTKEVAQ